MTERAPTTFFLILLMVSMVTCSSYCILYKEQCIHCPKGNRCSKIYVTRNVAGKTRYTKRNISCSISFSCTFRVISRKFGLSFGHNLSLLIKRGCSRCNGICSGYEPEIHFKKISRKCEYNGTSGPAVIGSVFMRRFRFFCDSSWNKVCMVNKSYTR